MAHADYNCCAICDSKLEYSEEATTKERICEGCLKDLRNIGLNILGVDELIEWINSVDLDIVNNALSKLCFRFCYYKNPLDDLLKKKGVKENTKSREVLTNLSPPSEEPEKGKGE